MNLLFNLMSHQPDFDKIYLNAKVPCEGKHQLLINKRESTDLKCLNDSQAFIEYSNNMGDIYRNIEEYNPNKKRKILIAFDDMIAHKLSTKIFNPSVTTLFIRCRKLNISLAFTTQSYTTAPKNIRLNSTHKFIAKIPNKRGLQQITLNHSSDIDCQDFISLYKKCSAKPYFLLVIESNLAPNLFLLENLICYLICYC